eukprot:TRINITY_DN8647_c0_g1_i1.p1 TRINITY_DN8647_c0_g1~~TRINITY_DN8647_c0_g1_i1.p1  ORF type:complete len:1057 (+),score=201.79 TRINITY_DN8647_c0_g1_i1:390-3173(+)
MGLGKTIEILGLVSENKRTEPCNIENYPKDTTLQYFDGDSTLIVAPGFLIKQWRKEITSATNLKVKEYEGTLKMNQTIRDETEEINIFEGYDVVLTSYDVLRKEVHFAKEFSKSLRTERKRFISPLVRTRWWRVCMDEAQEVKGKTTQIAKMVNEIPALFRWAISGTPVKTSFDDLKGVLVFLKSEDKWYKPTEEFLSWFKTIAWRHTKAHVHDQIKIPLPEDRNIAISPSHFEKICRKMLVAQLSSTGDLESAHHRAVLSKFETSPYSVMYNDVFEKQAKNKVFEQDRRSLLKLMIADATTSLYQSQVALCDSLNLIGAALSNRGDLSLRETSIEYFKKSFSLGSYKSGHHYFETYGALSEKCKTILSPPISVGFSNCTYHSAFFLSNLCEEPLSSLYGDICKNIKFTSLSSLSNGLEKLKLKWLHEVYEVSLMRDNRLNSPHTPWWERSLNYLEKYKKEEFLQSMRTGVQQSYSTKNVVQSKRSIAIPHLKSIKQLKKKLTQSVNEMHDARSLVIDLLQRTIKPDEDLEKLREHVENCEKAMTLFDKMLIKRTFVKEKGQPEVIVQEISLTEFVLLYIERLIILDFNYYYSKTTQFPDDLVTKNLYWQCDLLAQEANSFFRELEVMKLELTSGFKLIEGFKKYLNGIIELETKGNVLKDVYHLKSLQIDKLEQQIESNQQKVLNAKAYLEELYEEEFVIVEDDFKYGEKIGVVCQDIIKELGQSKTNKVLVFSSWAEGLVQLHALLEKHDVRCVSGPAINGIKSSGTIQKRIDIFRTDPEVRVLLLNALKQSTGLTLTQAKSILLMDPIDAASERQAIGRSYRIGQKSTTNILRYSIPQGEWTIERLSDNNIDNPNDTSIPQVLVAQRPRRKLPSTTTTTTTTYMNPLTISDDNIAADNVMTIEDDIDENNHYGDGDDDGIEILS